MNPQVWPPAKLLMQISNSASIEEFRSSFEHVRYSVSRYLTDAGFEFSEFDKVLDFGCGPGRFLFAWKDHLRPGQELFGCDVDKACADWASANIDFAEVRRNDLHPPLPYASSSMDLVYALSVFTHLTVDLQFAWARECFRILRPGGVLFLTTHSVVQMTTALKQLRVFKYNEFYAIGEQGFFASFSTENSEAVEGQREVAAYHSLEAIRSIFSPLVITKHHPISDMAGGQSLTILTKPRDLAILLPKSGFFQPTEAPSTFHAFILCGHQYHISSIEYVIVTRNERAICSGEVNLSLNKSFDSHFIELTVDVPVIDTEFGIHLIPPKEIASITVNYPMLVVRNLPQ